MKKNITLFILLLFTGLVLNSQNQGDSLAILYKHVYLYKNPSQLGSRVDSKGVSYLDKEKLYLFELDNNFPSYYKVISSSSDTAYVKSELVSHDQSLKHSTIQKEVSLGERKQDINDLINVNDYIPTWSIFLIAALLFYLIYLLIKHYAKFDAWFIRITGSKIKAIKHPWFLLFPLVFGFILGSFTLFSPKEAQWYFMDGWQLYGTYPNIWGWIMWFCTMASELILIIALVYSFFRFSFPFALLYSIILLPLITIVFLFGAFTGGFAVIVFVAYLYIESGSGSGYSNYVKIDGVLHKKTGPNTWEKV